MASNDPAYQSKEGYYPQQTKGTYDYSPGALNADKGEDYEILEAGQRFNDDTSAGLAERPWASGEDVEKQLRLGEFSFDLKTQQGTRILLRCHTVLYVNISTLLV